MFSEKDMEKMFLAGMDWERRSIQPVSLKEAIASALAQIKAAEQHMHADGACLKCGAEGYVILGDGRKYCNICKTPRP